MAAEVLRAHRRRFNVAAQPHGVDVTDAMVSQLHACLEAQQFTGISAVSGGRSLVRLPRGAGDGGQVEVGRFLLLVDAQIVQGLALMAYHTACDTSLDVPGTMRAWRVTVAPLVEDLNSAALLAMQVQKQRLSGSSCPLSLLTFVSSSPPPPHLPHTRYLPLRPSNAPQAQRKRVRREESEVGGAVAAVRDEEPGEDGVVGAEDGVVGAEVHARTAPVVPPDLAQPRTLHPVLLPCRRRRGHLRS